MGNFRRGQVYFSKVLGFPGSDLLSLITGEFSSEEDWKLHLGGGDRLCLGVLIPFISSKSCKVISFKKSKGVTPLHTLQSAVQKLVARKGRLYLD